MAEKKDKYFEGRIYVGCNQSEPQYHEFEPEEGQRDWNQDEEFNAAMIDFDNYLATLTSYPVHGSHNFKDGEDVTGRYELQYQWLLGFQTPNPKWSKCTKSEYYFHVMDERDGRRIVAIATPTDKVEGGKEYILCAATWYQELETSHTNPKNIDKGVVLCGYRHGDIIYQLLSLTGKRSVEPVCGKYVQGFLTNTNRFVDRQEAYKIAFTVNQIHGPNKGQSENLIGLTSEDLY